MLNNSPWLWGDRKSAAGMTARNSRGQHILQGKRAKGQSNPSPGYLSSQVAAHLIWPYFRKASGFVREFFKGIPTGSTAAAEFYKYAYNNGFTADGVGGGSFDTDGLAYSKGTMTQTSISTFTADVSDNAIEFTFPTTNADASQAATDKGWLVIINLSQNKAISGAIPGIRSGGTSGTIVPPPGFLVAGNNLALYLGFVSDVVTVLETNVSTSVVAHATVTA